MLPRIVVLCLAAALGLTLTAFGCSNSGQGAAASAGMGLATPVADPDTAIFAMGCFWCAETAFEGREGIVSVTSGFAGGHVENPSYSDVTAGGTGHYEVIEVVYAQDVISYDSLLHIFWRNIDPFDGGGQFCDRGSSYLPAIFATGEQRPAAEASLDEVDDRFEDAVQVPILGAAPFYPAEDYHQDFWMKDPERYYSYRRGCRRDARLRDIWGDEKLDDAVHAAGY